MTPQERDVIAGIFDRLRQAATQPRDPEAERFIADKLREQPYAPYAMAQAVYVQEQALLNLQSQVEQLQAQLRDLEQRPAEPQGGFLSSIFGSGQQPERPRSVPSVGGQRGAGASGLWSNRSAAPGMNAAPMQPGAGAPEQGQPGPWGQQAAQQPARSGFLGSALTTAAGVAGGMVLGNVLMNAFKGDSASSGSTAANSGDSASAQPASDDGGGGYGDAQSGATYQNAGHDEAYDDGSSDFGGDDDWA